MLYSLVIGCVFVALFHNIFAENTADGIWNDGKNELMTKIDTKKGNIVGEMINSGDSQWFSSKQKEKQNSDRKKRNTIIDFTSNDCQQLEENFELPWFLLKWCSLMQNKRDKPKSRQFSPRLGRDSGEDGISGKWMQDIQPYSYIYQRSPPFAPRLGRRGTGFIPRLGRELSY